MKVSAYQMVSAEHPADLNPQVQKMVREGWEPYGAPLCPSAGPFAQAMVKPVLKLPKPLDEEWRAAATAKFYRKRHIEDGGLRRDEGE